MSGVPAKAPSKVPMKARPGSPPAVGTKVAAKGSASPPAGAKSPVAGSKAPVGAKAPVASKTPVAGKAPVGKAPVTKAPVSAATSPSGKAPVAKVAAKAPVGSPPRAAASPSGATSPSAKAPAKKMIAKKAPVAAAAVLPPVSTVAPEPEPEVEVATSRAASIAPSQAYEPSEANPTASANASFAPSVAGDHVEREPSLQSVVSGNGGGPATVVIDSSLATGGMSASDAIAKNQQAAAALAALIGKQQEIDNEKIKALEEKNGILVKLLREREDELKGKIAEIEKEHSKLQHTYLSSKRENEVLKEILSDRDGPKLVQKIEFMEDDAKRLREDLSKWKEMADYHRDAHLQALDHVQRLKEGQPIGPTETDWNDAQEKVARLARDNTNLTFKLASMEERVGTMENTGGSGGGGYISPSYNNAASSSPQRAVEYGGQRAAGLNQSVASQSPFRNSHNGYLLRDQKGASVGGSNNNAHFSSYSGSPVRGAPSTAGVGGVKGWRALLLPNGNVVYHNMITNRSQWEIPEELANSLVEHPTYR